MTVVRYLNKHPQTLAPLEGDSQAHRVFRLESDISGLSIGHKMILKDLQEVAKNVGFTWRVPVPKIELVDKRERIYGWQDDVGIKLNTPHDGQNLFTLLHELAHWIVVRRDYAIEDHGPEWVWIYIELLDQYKMLPRECSLLLCQKYNIEVG